MTRDECVSTIGANLLREAEARGHVLTAELVYECLLRNECDSIETLPDAKLAELAEEVARVVERDVKRRTAR